MRTLKRNKRGLYLCKRYLDEGIEKFKEPIFIEINYQPINSNEQLYAYGINYSKYLIAKVDIDVGEQFSAGDRCYIYVTPPTTFDILCEDADYIVSGELSTTLNSTEIRFKRLSVNEDS